MRKHINRVAGLPAARLPFSSGVVAEGKFLFVAGQGPYDSKSNRFVRGSIAEQTELTLACIGRIIEAAGANFVNVVSCRAFLQQLFETLPQMTALRAMGNPEKAAEEMGARLFDLYTSALIEFLNEFFTWEHLRRNSI